MVRSSTFRAIVKIQFEEHLGNLVLNDYANEIPIWGVVEDPGELDVSTNLSDGSFTTIPYPILKKGDIVLFYYAAVLNAPIELLRHNVVSIRHCDIVAYQKNGETYTANNNVLLTREYKVDGEEPPIAIRKGDRVTYMPARNYPVYKVIALPEKKECYSIADKKYYAFKKSERWLKKGDVVLVDARQTIRLNPQGQYTPVDNGTVICVVDSKYIYAKEETDG